MGTQAAGGARVTDWKPATVEVTYPKISRPGREYRPGWWRPAPEDETGPVPSVPTQVVYEDYLWTVLDVDVLGRWLIAREESDYEHEVYIQFYVLAEELSVPEVYDTRPWVGCRELGVIDRLLRELYLPQIKRQLEQDWTRALFGSS